MNPIAAAYYGSLGGDQPSGGDSIFVTGQSFTTSSNNFSGPLGFDFTVGGADITITQLGRWVKSGNNQTHVLYFRTWRSGGTLASVTVDCNGATPGDYVWGTLSSPYVLYAGLRCVLYTTEVSGLDDWYDGSNCTISTTPVASVTDAALDFGAGDTDAGYGANHTWGPVNFKYHL